METVAARRDVLLPRVAAGASQGAPPPELVAELASRKNR